MLWEIILICICISYGMKNRKRFKSVLEGCRELENIKKSSYFMMFLLSLADLVQAVLLYRYGDECYLTAQGIAAVEGVYEKRKCRFVMELSEGGDSYIDVYKGEGQVPFRFKVLEKEKEAVRLVNHLFYQC